MVVVAGIDAAWQAARHAYELIAGQAAHVNAWWLVAGLALHLIASAVRQPGWLAILRAAHPDDAKDLRLRDVEAAYFAGAGLNGVIPARGGDVVKLFLLHRRIDRSSYATLAGSLVPESLFETSCGVLLVIWMATQGFLPIPTSPAELPSLDVSFLIAHPFLSTFIALGIGAAFALVYGKLRASVKRFLLRVRQGLAILRSPRAYLVQV